MVVKRRKRTDSSDEKGNILFCGVGGQGILLASEVVGYALIQNGFDVKKSEVHGMAQRGGSVEAFLRFGKKVYSPLIEPTTVDIQVSFELLESLRYLPMLGKQSRIIVNTQKIPPLSVSTGIETYPDGIIERLKGFGLEVYPIDAFQISKEIGEVRTVNMVLVGALSNFLPVDEDAFLDVIKWRVPERFREVNLEAFKRGRGLIDNIK
jgi:indolepyruvate ferredoxin oxidoreductase beta subunit